MPADPLELTLDDLPEPHQPRLPLHPEPHKHPVQLLRADSLEPLAISECKLKPFSPRYHVPETAFMRFEIVEPTEHAGVLVVMAP